MTSCLLHPNFPPPGVLGGVTGSVAPPRPLGADIAAVYPVSQSLGSATIQFCLQQLIPNGCGIQPAPHCSD